MPRGGTATWGGAGPDQPPTSSTDASKLDINADPKEAGRKNAERSQPGRPVRSEVALDSVNVEQIIDVQLRLDAGPAHLEVSREPPVELIEPVAIQRASRDELYPL